jgi:hypothetical protein
MLGVRWSHARLALPFIAFLRSLGSYKQYGTILLSLSEHRRGLNLASLFLMPLPLHSY